VLRYQWRGANAAPKIVGLNELPGKSNYFIGNDPAKWYTSVPNYARVEYQGIYPGINLAYYGSGGQVEYDFIVTPGSDPSRISMAVTGADKVTLDAGNLVLHTALGELRQPAPHIYQDGPNGRQAVVGGYTLADAGAVGFTLSAYDRTRPLIIDPTLYYSTYLGGSSDDFNNGTTDFTGGITVSSAGNIYLTGGSLSTNFPTTIGAFQTTKADGYDAIVTELTSTGCASGVRYCPRYSTYIGGHASGEKFSGDDYGNAIALDTSGNAYITGATFSADFPVGNAIQGSNNGGIFYGDAFVTELNSSGSGLVYSTYLGGSFDDEGRGIAVDSSGEAWVTGWTESDTYGGAMHFPTQSPIQAACAGPIGNCHSAFVTKVPANPTPSSTWLFSSFLGGNNMDQGNAVTLDSSGNAFIVGSTNSATFPITTGAYQTTLGGGNDAFITKVKSTPGAAWSYSTYLGGSSNDFGTGIALDSFSNVYVTGETQSTNFPISGAYQSTNAGSYDAFVTELNGVMGTTPGLVYSTYIGGSGDDETSSIAVHNGDAFITGYTASTNFPLQSALYTSNAGGTDAFVTKVIHPAVGTSCSGLHVCLSYSTYVGGTSDDAGLGIATDSSGNAFIAGRTRSSGAGGFPTAHPYQATNAGGQDGFVLEIQP